MSLFPDGPLSASVLYDVDAARTPTERAQRVWYMELSDVVRVRDWMEACCYPGPEAVAAGGTAFISEAGWPILFGHIICPHGADPGPHRIVDRAADPFLRRQVMDTALGAYVYRIMRATGLPDWQ